MLETEALNNNFHRCDVVDSSGDAPLGVLGTRNIWVKNYSGATARAKRAQAEPHWFMRTIEAEV